MEAQLIQLEAAAQADSRRDEVLSMLAAMIGSETIPHLGKFYSCSCAFFRKQQEFMVILRIYTEKKKAIHFFDRP